MASKIRFADVRDAHAIRAIYAPFVEATVVSFEIVPPTVEEMASRIERVSSQYPWLVAEIEDQLAAYVYACQHRERAAYRWAVDVTVYVEQPYRRRGVARALYTCLISLLRRQGFMHAYAGITLPNEGSVGVHEAVGFQRIATYPAIGFKFGEWRDVGWWHLPLQSRPQDPAEPQPITRIRDLPETAALLAEASNMLGR